MATVTLSDRGELVDLEHPDTQSYLAESFDWLRDLTAKAAREAAQSTDDWAQALDQLQLSNGRLADYLREQDNWVANLFGEILAVIETVNPLAAGKQIAIWILEDFRDLLRAVATLIDSKEESAEETQEALVEIALAGAALAVPYVGRAGKIVARIFKGMTKLEDGLGMLRYIGKGDVVKYLKELNLPKYAAEVGRLLRKIVEKIGQTLERWLPSVKRTLDVWVGKIVGWIKAILTKIQAWLNAALAKIQKAV